MEQIIQIGQKSYRGRTFPEVLNYGHLGLEQHNIKIVPYVQDFPRGEIKAFKELHFRNWVTKLNQKGAYVVLWKGKYKVTTVQKEYANMVVVGALFIPNESIEKIFNCMRVDRKFRLKAQSMLMEILRGTREEQQKGLLSILNNVRWNVEIVDYMDRKVFTKSKLSENKATDILKLEINKLKGRHNEKAKS